MNSHITLGQIFAALSRNKMRSFLTFCLMMLLVVAMFIIWPRKYGSEGRLYVQVGRSNTGLDPTPGQGAISIQDSRETEIRSVVELVKSRAIIEAAVDKVGVERILESKLDFITDKLPSISLSSLLPSKDDNGMSAEEYDRLKRRELAAKKLEKNMVVDSEKKTSVISVYVKASSPLLAQELVNEIMALTCTKNLEVHSVKGSTRFFDTEFTNHDKKLSDAIAAQTEFRNQHNLLSIDGSRNSLQNIIGGLENQLITAEVEAASLSEKVRKLTYEMSKISRTTMVPKSGVEKLSFEDSRTEVFKLEARRDELVSTFHPSHPQVRKIEEALKRSQKKLSEMTSDRTEEVAAINPVFEKIKVNFVSALVDRDSAEARRANLVTKVNEAKERLRELNGVQMVADKHQRNVNVARQFLSLYTQKLGESKVMEQLDQQEISDVVVAQPGNLVVKHVSPRGSVLLPMGMLASFALSLATALYFQRNHLSSALSEDEVEQILDIPVLVTLPRVYSVRDMVN